MKCLSKILPIVLAAVLALSACKPAAPANHLEAIKAKGKMVVGTSADYPPFEYVDEAGKVVGFDIDLINEIGARLGVKVEVVDMPFDTLIAGVQEGKIDLSIAAFNYTEERDKVVDFTDAYYYAEDGFIVAEDFAGKITDPKDVADLKIGVQTGATADGWVVENLVDTGLTPAENVFRYERVDQGALDVQAGRIDVFITDYVPAEALVKKVEGLKIAYHAEVSTGPVLIIMPEGDVVLTAEINKIIADLLKEGFIDQLSVKHIGQ